MPVCFLLKVHVFMLLCDCRMETVCGNAVKRIELEKRVTQLKVGLFHLAHVCNQLVVLWFSLHKSIISCIFANCRYQ